MLLMPMLYLPPLSYIALMNAAGDVCIEAHENYIKSTYRNRCEIVGSNGIIDLSIPLIGGRDHKHLYSESLIDYTNGWQHRHRMSILSCYGSAPFFEHYMPYLDTFYNKEYKYLFDFNKTLLELMIKLMKLSVTLNYTGVYVKEPETKTDLRKSFKPGIELQEIRVGEKRWQISPVSYIRVFDNSNEGLNVSCLDLLFNEGPQSKKVLQGMVTKT